MAASHPHGCLAVHLFFVLVEALTLTTEWRHMNSIWIRIIWIYYVKWVPLITVIILCIVAAKHIAVFFSVGQHFLLPTWISLEMIPTINCQAFRNSFCRLRWVEHAEHARCTAPFTLWFSHPWATASFCAWEGKCHVYLPRFNTVLVSIWFAFSIRLHVQGWAPVRFLPTSRK